MMTKTRTRNKNNNTRTEDKKTTISYFASPMPYCRLPHNLTLHPPCHNIRNNNLKPVLIRRKRHSILNQIQLNKKGTFSVFHHPCLRSVMQFYLQGLCVDVILYSHFCREHREKIRSRDLNSDGKSLEIKIIAVFLLKKEEQEEDGKEEEEEEEEEGNRRRRRGRGK